MAGWFFGNDDKGHGPFSLNQLDQLLKLGTLRPEAEVWSSDSEQVHLLSDLIGKTNRVNGKLQLSKLPDSVDPKTATPDARQRSSSLLPWLLAAALWLSAIVVSSVAERVNLVDQALASLAERPQDLAGINTWEIDESTNSNTESQTSETNAQESNSENAPSNIFHATDNPDGDLSAAKSGHLRMLRGHRGNVNCVAISPITGQCVSGGSDRTVFLWDLQDGSTVWRNNRFSREVLAVCWRGDKVLACDRQSVRWLDAQTGRTLEMLRIESCDRAVFSKNGRLLMTSLHDSTGRLIDLDAKQTETFDDELQAVYSAAFAPISGSLVFGTNNQHVYHRSTKQTRANVISQTSFVESIDVAVNGQLAATGSGKHTQDDQESDYTARVWNLETGQVVVKFEHHDQWIYAIRFTPDSRRVISAGGGDFEDPFGYETGADTAIRIWDARSGKYLAQLEGHTSAVLCLDISHDGRVLISGSADHCVRVWKLPEL